MFKTPKIGLSLSGGAARGLAHIGVLKALEEKSIPIHMISGTSAGALVGAYYAKERNVTALEEIVLGMDWKQLARLVDMNLKSPWKGFIQGQKVKDFLISLIGDIKFKDLEIPFAVVTTDIETMEELIIKEGSVIEAVRASISMPGIFTPVRWHNKFLIDGGVVNPIPVDVVRSMGADMVIASNTIGLAQQRKGKQHSRRETEAKLNFYIGNTRLSVLKKRINNLALYDKDKIKILDDLFNIAKSKIYALRGEAEAKAPNIFDVMTQSIHAMEYKLSKLALEPADIIINPDISHIGTFEFHRAEESISQGYKATHIVLPKLQKKIRCSRLIPMIRLPYSHGKHR
ncbi:MAG: patatin-like phospholipase family protein [Dehalococcoidia bacterium]|nr:patatin-like phospholipase family protein [Dehalococcoidia bacterium]